MSGAGAKRRSAVVARGYLRARNGAGWDERCSALFEDLRKPARVMVARAYGRALSAEEVEDVYANAWTSTLAALRGRESTMSDEDLRSYLLTAVAGHAGKEMRRRSRKPAGPLEDVHAQVLADAHQPLPEERVTGSETASVARDLLASLPARRRAVMLLRYGWGLSPSEICRMVSGLSPRAYRKEITRGVEQMIERLGALEEGSWCETREPILRDYVAGVADEDTRRQAVQHIAHCRSCGELVARLSGRLHELGSGAVLGTIGLEGLGLPASLLDRLGAIADRGREAAVERGEAVGELAAGMAMSGTGRGAGAAGAGLAAKLAGLGAAGKAALAAIGVGAAAGAFIAVGAVPGVEIGTRAPAGGEAPAPAERSEPRPLGAATASEIAVAGLAAEGGAEAASTLEAAGTGSGDREQSSGDDGDRAATADPQPASEPAAGEQEFGLPTPGETATAAPAPGPAPVTTSASDSGSGGSASTDAAVREFGP